MSPLVMAGTSSSDSSSTLKRSTAWATSSKALAPSFSLVVWNGDGQCHTQSVMNDDEYVSRGCGAHCANQNTTCRGKVLCQRMKVRKSTGDNV